MFYNSYYIFGTKESLSAKIENVMKFFANAYRKNIANSSALVKFINRLKIARAQFYYKWNIALYLYIWIFK